MKKNKMDTQEYQFIKETVKKQPKENGSLLRRLLMIAGCGVLFGGCAAVTFASVFPVMADREENTWREAIIKDFGEKIELPVPSKAGYTFDGWVSAQKDYDAKDVYQAPNGTALSALWTEGDPEPDPVPSPTPPPFVEEEE